MLLEHGQSEADVRRRGGRTGWSMQDHLDRDTHPVPDVMRWHSRDETLGDGAVARERYVSRSFHDLNVERLWPRVWQMACHQDEIPAVGDAMVYEIGDHSVMVVGAAGAFKAYPNSCLHRGTKLCPEPGRYRELRCPFHAWTWNLDGTLKDIPSRWDFPQLDGCDVSLPEVGVDTWGGLRVREPRPGGGPAVGAPRRAGRPLRAVAARGPAGRAVGAPGGRLQLEGRHRGLRRGLPRDRHAPADGVLQRRRRQPVRHLARRGELQPLPVHRRPSPATTWATTSASRRSPTSSSSRRGWARPTAVPSSSPTASWPATAWPGACGSCSGRPPRSTSRP